MHACMAATPWGTGIQTLRAPVDDGVHQHLDGVLVGQQGDDVECVLDDAHLREQQRSPQKPSSHACQSVSRTHAGPHVCAHIDVPAALCTYCCGLFDTP